jgi:hypothetical protein
MSAAIVAMHACLPEKNARHFMDINMQKRRENGVSACLLKKYQIVLCMLAGSQNG